MKEQNFSNHARFVPTYHYLTAILILVGLGFSGFLVYREAASLLSLSVLLLYIIAVPTYFNYRGFALRAQDRAIRSEENFRHFVMTGKPLNTKLRLGQIIALRFASDEEYLALVERAVNENLSVVEIKKAITKWKADHHRA